MPHEQDVGDHDEIGKLLHRIVLAEIAMAELAAQRGNQVGGNRAKAERKEFLRRRPVITPRTR